MKIAHLILAHSAPQQLERLIDRLRHQDACFFIHIDNKTNLDLFKYLTSKERVYLVSDRVKVSWGAYSIVQATVNGFQAIADSGLEIDYVNLLSGADYPLKSANDIHNFFTENQGINFIEFQSVNEEWLEAIPRLKKYHLTNYSFPGKYAVQKWINKLTSDRTMPEKLIAVGRSQWMSITLESVKYLLHYLQTHQNVVRFFKLTWAPDEIIFHTILYNSGFRESMVNNNLRYTDWAAGKASPETLDVQDFDKLIISNKLFARKFDGLKHPEILDLLDKQIGNPG